MDKNLAKPELMVSNCMRPVLGSGSVSANKDELEKTADKGHRSETSQSASGWGTVRHVFVVCLLCLLQIFVGGAYSVVGSFFPIESRAMNGVSTKETLIVSLGEAAEKGSNTFTTGLIVGAPAFSMMIISPLSGCFLPKLGVRFTMVSGNLLVGGAFFLLAFLIDMPSTEMFVIFGILLRLVEGVGWAMCNTTTFALLPQLFPSRIATLSGIIAAVIGIGYAAGPSVGSLLFIVGGYRAPFFTIGGAILLLVPATIILIKPTTSSSDVIPVFTVFKLLSYLSFSSICLATVATYFSYTFLDVAFATFLLDEVGFSQIQIGIVFSIMAVAYLLSAFLGGRLADKFGTRRFIIGGLFIGGASIFIIALPPFSSISYWWIITSSIALFGGGTALILVPTYSDLLKQSQKWDQDKQNSALDSTVSGLKTLSRALGDLLGALVGGFLAHVTDFTTTFLLIGEAITAIAFLVLGVSLIDFVHERYEKH